MNLTALTARKIKQVGRDLLTPAGDTLRCYLSSDSQAQFLPGAPISHGDLLSDPAANKTYIVSEIRQRPECQYVNLQPYHQTCSISRLSAPVDAFGRRSEDPVTIADCPVLFQTDSKAAVPAGTPVRSGDVLTVTQTGDRYLLKAVTADCLPGLLVLHLEQINPNDLQAAM